MFRDGGFLFRDWHLESQITMAYYSLHLNTKDCPMKKLVPAENSFAARAEAKGLIMIAFHASDCRGCGDYHVSLFVASIPIGKLRVGEGLCGGCALEVLQ